MNRTLCSTSNLRRCARLLLVVVAVCAALASSARAQQVEKTSPAPTPTPNRITASVSTVVSEAKPATSDERAEQVLERVLKTVGGSAFLGVQTVVSRGYFTQFKDGISGTPSTFVDYLAFPDRERTEFKGKGVKLVQTNTGASGWLYDGMVRKLSDINPEQAKDFQTTMRTSVDNLLRGWWRKEGASLTYMGRREAGLAKRNDVVRLTYPDGFAVEFEFGTRDNLPYKVLYKRRSAEGEETAEEDRLAQHLSVNGVIMPFIIDHFRAGAQTSRINYEAIELNRPIPDTLFQRPADIKAIK